MCKKKFTFHSEGFSWTCLAIRHYHDFSPADDCVNQQGNLGEYFLVRFSAAVHLIERENLIRDFDSGLQVCY